MLYDSISAYSWYTPSTSEIYRTQLVWCEKVSQAEDNIDMFGSGNTGNVAVL